MAVRRCSSLAAVPDTGRRLDRRFGLGGVAERSASGKRPPVDAAHRRLRAELLPAAIGTLCPLGCGRVIDATAHLDHIVARARGGQTTRGNCRIICKPCNMERGARLGGKAAHAKASQARRAQPALGLGSRGPHW